MPREFLSLPSFSGVAANATATINLPTDNRYTKLQAVYTTATAGGASLANMIAEITEIRLMVNGTAQRTFSFDQLQKINAQRGIAFKIGIIEIFMAPPWARAAQGEDVLSWGMEDVQSFQLEIDIGAATTPTLSIKREILRGNTPMGIIAKWKRFNVQVAATGVLNWADLPTGDQVYALNCFETTTGDISAVELKIDEVQKFKATAAEATALYASHGFVDQAAVFAVTPNYTQRVFDAWATADFDSAGKLIRRKNVSLDFTMAVAANFVIVAETLGFRD